MYIKLDNRNVIIGAISGGTPSNLSIYIEIPERDVMTMFDLDGVPLCKWDGENVIPRTPEEIEADRAKLPPPPPTPQQQIDELRESLNSITTGIESTR